MVDYYGRCNQFAMRVSYRTRTAVVRRANHLPSTVNSTAYTFTYGQLEREFHSSREVNTLGLSLFVVGLACGPLFLAPLSEFYGRRWIYIISFIFVFIFIIPCAVAQNIQTIIITRFFDGVAGSTFLSVAGGTIGDMFDKAELSMPMMVYSGSPFLGPATGPIIAGFINQYTSWVCVLATSCLISEAD